MTLFSITVRGTPPFGDSTVATSKVQQYKRFDQTSFPTLSMSVTHNTEMQSKYAQAAHFDSLQAELV